jgi:hypothetical protein
MKLIVEQKMKIVGKRTIVQPFGFTEEFNNFQKLAGEFRDKKISHPRGVFRFKTHKEADEWYYKIIIQKQHAHQQ